MAVAGRRVSESESSEEICSSSVRPRRFGMARCHALVSLRQAAPLIVVVMITIII